MHSIFVFLANRCPLKCIKAVPMCRRSEETMVTPSKKFGPSGGHQMYHHQSHPKGSSNTKRPNSTPISSSPPSSKSPSQHKSVAGPKQSKVPSGSALKTPATRSHSTPIAVPNRAGRGNAKLLSPSPSRMSPKSFASSKCFEPPTPLLLPQPPMSWMEEKSLFADDKDVRDEGAALLDLSQQLKLILKVQA